MSGWKDRKGRSSKQVHNILLVVLRLLYQAIACFVRAILSPISPPPFPPPSLPSPPTPQQTHLPDPPRSPAYPLRSKATATSGAHEGRACTYPRRSSRHIGWRDAQTAPRHAYLSSSPTAAAAAAAAAAAGAALVGVGKRRAEESTACSSNTLRCSGDDDSGKGESGETRFEGGTAFAPSIRSLRVFLSDVYGAQVL